MPSPNNPAPPGTDAVARRNFRLVQLDAAAVGISAAAAPFLPVFLARLGATPLEVGLLTTMPAVGGLLFVLAAGRFLQSRRNIIPWFSTSRMLYLSAYAFTGAAPFLLPRHLLIPAVLVVWAAATIPQVILNVAFTVAMDAVAGSESRYDLLSRRWTILGVTTAVTVVLAGGLLDRIAFPVNYQAVFLVLSVSGIFSFFLTGGIRLPDREPAAESAGVSFRARASGYLALIRSRPAFVSFSSKQFIYIAGVALAQPILPLYLVREVQASDFWIGAISMVQTAVVLFGYPFWARQSRRRSPRFVLVATTLGAAAYPLLAALTRQPAVITLIAGLAGIFQAGIDLVFFDEMLKTVPREYCAVFVSLSQEIQYAAAVAAPLLGIALAGILGLPGALIVSGLIRLTGAALFAHANRTAPR